MYGNLIECEDLPWPKDISEGALYFSEKHGMVSYKCPCGCGTTATHAVNFPGKKSGFTTVWEFDPKTITLSPSIQVLGGCESHYYIENGDVRWAE